MIFKKMISGFALLSLFLLFGGGVHAGPSSAPGSDWQSWLADQIVSHPDLVAARAAMNASLAQAEALEQALYNPELNTEYEREGEDNNYLVGLNQTVDFWDKRGARSQQARFVRQAARELFVLSLQQRSAEVLQLFVQWQAAFETVELMEKLEARLKALLVLVKKRERAGDLGQLDVELAFLDLSQRLNQTALAQANLLQLEFQLRNLLSEWNPGMLSIPESFWDEVASRPLLIPQELEGLSDVLLAKAQWQASREAADLAARNGKADPTLGLNAGETGAERVISLSFSIPLFVRNSFSAETRAAGQEASSARAGYESLLRSKGLAVEAAYAVMEQYSLRYRASRNLVAGRRQSSGALLGKQWRSGDLSTMDYILTMDRRSEALLAGIELNSQYRQACIEWLLGSGGLKVFFK